MTNDNSKRRFVHPRNLLQPKAIVTMLIAIGLIVCFRHPISTGVSRLISKNADEAPLDQEIDEINSMIGNLLPDIREQIIRVAKADTSSKLSVEAAAARERELLVCQDELMRLHQSAQSGSTSTLKIGDRDATPAEVEAELARLLNVAQLLEDTLRVEQETASSEKSVLVQEQTELKRLIDKKREMEVQVASFRARLASVNSRQTGPLNREENKLVDQCREKVDEVSARLKVAEQILAVQDQFTMQTPPQQPLEARSKDVMNDVERYFESHDLVSAGKVKE